ncbi:MAG TPA: universal stress protein, partial [Micromonosporaceae bacterium]
AVDPVLSAAAARAYSEFPLLEDTRKALAAFVRRTLRREAAAVTVAVVVGPPRQMLMRESRRRRPDLVVLGTSGRGGLSKLFFGSTTEALLRRYHGAVLVVPPRCPHPDARWPHGGVVAVVGPGPHRRARISAASRMAEIFGAWLTVSIPDVRLSRTRWHRDRLAVLALPDAARIQTFRQGTVAYEFLRRSALPVIVMRTGRRIGHVEARRAA